MAIERLEEAHDEFARRFNAGDVEGLVELYEEGAKLVLPEGEVVGRDAIREALGRFVELKGTMRMETVGVIEGDGVAVTSGAWRLEGADGKLIMQGESVEVFRKGPGGWRAVVDSPFGVG